jgi:hypothetical protein
VQNGVYLTDKKAEGNPLPFCLSLQGSTHIVSAGTGLEKRPHMSLHLLKKRAQGAGAVFGGRGIGGRHERNAVAILEISKKLLIIVPTYGIILLATSGV